MTWQDHIERAPESLVSTPGRASGARQGRQVLEQAGSITHMNASSSKWRSLGEPATPAEAEALDAVRALLPDDAVTHAWANLTFLDLDGRTAEVDVLLLSKVGLFVVELKGWHGTIDGDQQNWRVTGPNGNVRNVRNPLFATDQKAKRLRSLLEYTAPNPRARKEVPFVGALVVLHGRGSEIRLPETARAGLLALDGFDVRGPLTPLSRFLSTPPENPNRIIDGPRARTILGLLSNAGFTPTPKNRYVGQYPLDKADPLDSGPAWQDLLASHPGAPSVKVRLRVFDVPPGASEERRQEVERAARRAFVLTRGIAHPGIACPSELVLTDGAPALVYEYDDAEVPLTTYLADAGPSLDLSARLDLVRQMGDALRYAHQRRLVHRALAPNRVYVSTRTTPPRVVIRDWQTAGHAAGTTATSHRPLTTTSLGSTDVRSLVGHDDWVYLAPEVIRGADDLPAIPLDVYGLGALTYLVLTGGPPASALADLQQRMERSRCLDPRDVEPSTPDVLAELVRAATQYADSDRLESVEEFLRLLTAAEDELTAPAAATPLEERPRAADPLGAGQGDVIGDRFIVLERRGSGSTGTALLVEDYDRDGGKAILKIAKDDVAARRLRDEAEVLAGLDHPRVVRLVDGPIEVDGRTAVLISDAGRDTLAGWLETRGRATLSELERFGSDLMEAVAYLDSRGIFHRDVKPANLGISPDRSTRTPRLVLFDLSLAREPLENIASGTRGYTDPYLGMPAPAGAPARRRYDRAAELYGVAATLFEMATRQLPWWRDGEASPASASDRPFISPQMFEASVAEDLQAFFTRALSPDVAERFGDVVEMARAWQAIFAHVDTPEDEAEDAAARDAAADAATLDTPLEQAGLSARALSALARLQARTVGELVRTSPMAINSVPGLGERQRKEVQRRVRQWRERLVPTGGTTSEATPASGDVSVETTLNRLLPVPGKAGDTEVAVLRLLVGMPLGAGAGDDAAVGGWPTAGELAERVGVTRPRVSQILDAASQRWQRSSTVRGLVAEVVEAVDTEQGVATVDEVAAALLLRHGSLAQGPARLRRAAGLVRVAVETDARSAEPRLVVRRPRGDAPVLLSTVGDGALDDAQELARRADRLLDAQSVVPASVAREALRRVATSVELSDDRLLRLAAAASGTARLSSLHELYRPTIDPADAVVVALRGVSVPSLAEEGVRRRVSSRFPDAPPLPPRPALDELVAAALPGMAWDGSRYTRPTHGLTTGASSSVATRMVAQPRDVVDAALRGSLDRRSAVTLCVRPSRYAAATSLLAEVYGVRVVDVAAELVAATRRLAERDEVDWSLVLRTDADPASPDWVHLRGLVHEAVEEPWARVTGAPEPLLLTHLAPLARYGLTHLLSELVDQAQPRPAARWLLVPFKGSARAPTLDGHPVPLGPDRWLDLPDLSVLRPEVSA